MSRRERLLRTPLAIFFSAETAGALILLLATVAALLWANSEWSELYERVWHTSITLQVADAGAVFDLRHLVNEGLMTLFFFVVGLEIKRELTSGELADRRKAALPIVAAAGGMIVPALIYLALNASGAGQRGWGIPIATDIAFALGVFALLGRGLPSSLRVFLLSLAIVDDIGAIVVIALFYTATLNVVALGLAALLVGAVLVLWRVHRTWSDVPLVLAMLATWLAVLVSGVHPTIAGVVLGLSAPSRRNGESSPAERLGHTFHPWTSYLVIPLFALANAGVTIDAAVVAAAVGSSVTHGIVAGLVVGKLVGVSAAAYLAVRTGIASLPSGVRWSHIVAVAAIAGIGYTVSLFIADLSFAGTPIAAEAKAGIVTGSIVAALLGAALLRVSTSTRPGAPSPDRAAAVP